MSVVEHVWDQRPSGQDRAHRRSGRRGADQEQRLALLEQEVSELEATCKTLLHVLREAGVMTDDRIDALRDAVLRKGVDAADPAGQNLPR